MSMVDALIRRPIWEQTGGNTAGVGGSMGTNQGAGNIDTNSIDQNIATSISLDPNSPFGGFPTVSDQFSKGIASMAKGIPGVSLAQSLAGRAATNKSLGDMGISMDVSQDVATGIDNAVDQFSGPVTDIPGSAPSGGGDGGPGTGGNSGTGEDSGAGNGGASGPSGTGYYNGGMVTESSLRGPDPRGPDEGHIPIQSNEYVLSREVIKKLGPDMMKMIAALS